MALPETLHELQEFYANGEWREDCRLDYRVNEGFQSQIGRIESCIKNKQPLHKPEGTVLIVHGSQVNAAEDMYEMAKWLAGLNEGDNTLSSLNIEDIQLDELLLIYGEIIILSRIGQLTYIQEFPEIIPNLQNISQSDFLVTGISESKQVRSFNLENYQLYAYCALFSLSDYFPRVQKNHISKRCSEERAENFTSALEHSLKSTVLLSECSAALMASLADRAGSLLEFQENKNDNYEKRTTASAGREGGKKSKTSIGRMEAMEIILRENPDIRAHSCWQKLRIMATEERLIDVSSADKNPNLPTKTYILSIIKKNANEAIKSHNTTDNCSDGEAIKWESFKTKFKKTKNEIIQKINLRP